MLNSAAQKLLAGSRRTFVLKDLIGYESKQYKSLLEEVSLYPNQGVGFRIAKIYWPENHYVKILHVEYENNKIARIFGRKYANGAPEHDSIVQVDRVTTRGLWKYDIADAFCDLGNGLIYTNKDFEAYFKTVRQRKYKRPSDLRKNMKWSPPEGAIEPIVNDNMRQL